VKSRREIAIAQKWVPKTIYYQNKALELVVLIMCAKILDRTCCYCLRRYFVRADFDLDKNADSVFGTS
jgi:hypothetical protein